MMRDWQKTPKGSKEGVERTGGNQKLSTRNKRFACIHGWQSHGQKHITNGWGAATTSATKWKTTTRFSGPGTSHHRLSSLFL